MKPWEYGPLSVAGDHKYLQNGDRPFFWLADTAWLLFTNVPDEKEAYLYLKNRADKGFNVIQAVFVYATEELADVNKMGIREVDYFGEAYWKYCDRIIDMAESLGLYMALLPNWGSLVKHHVLREDNYEKYYDFLCRRYGTRRNIIWILGGDIKAADYTGLYEKMAHFVKAHTTEQLICFHPFGRCSSTDWFADSDWIDIHMFQSGHRRYDQGHLQAWDDNGARQEFFGPDNWKYVLRDHQRSARPTLDAEPSYEWILQGLHDPSQPYWVAKDVRRYAYWSVFAGACGHTYGDNSVMQFFQEGIKGVCYGAREEWKTAIHHEGSAQMGYLKKLMESVHYADGQPRDDLLPDGQREKYDRVAVFAGQEFLFAYNYEGKPFRIDLQDYAGRDMYYMSAAKGYFSYLGKVGPEICYTSRTFGLGQDDRDYVLAVR